MRKNLEFTMHDILCFSSTDWDDIWGSRQQVMIRMAQRGHRVFFIERQTRVELLMRYPIQRQNKWKRWQEGIRTLETTGAPIHIVSLPPLLPGAYYAVAINTLNQRLLRPWVKRFLRKYDVVDPILWLYKPEQYPLIGQFGESISVYHCIDEFTAGTVGRKKKTIQTLEENLLTQVDLVFANSQLTYKSKRKINPNTFRIPSGADVEHFLQIQNPACKLHPSIADIPTPIAGFLGNIAERIDVSLLATIAESLPNWQFVFVGQVHPQLVDVQPLKNRPNIHLLGKFPFAQLPSLAKGFDICLLPYVQNDELAQYRSPLKLYEYLATGKPIISTPQPEAEEFEGLIHIASTAEEWIYQIETIGINDTPSKKTARLTEANKHSWDARVHRMESHIYGLLNIERK